MLIKEHLNNVFLKSLLMGINEVFKIKCLWKKCFVNILKTILKKLINFHKQLTEKFIFEAKEKS